MREMISGKSKLVVGLVTGLLFGGVATAWATIPDSSGVIHGCYLKSNGALRIIDDSLDTCKGAETPLMWSVRGAQGLQGPQGSPGPQGPAGAVSTQQVYANTAIDCSIATCDIGRDIRVTDPCPTGTVLGGGADVLDADTGRAPTVLNIVASEPNTEGWFASATFTAHVTAQTLVLEVTAICSSS